MAHSGAAPADGWMQDDLLLSRIVSFRTRLAEQSYSNEISCPRTCTVYGEESWDGRCRRGSSISPRTSNVNTLTGLKKL